MKQSKIKAERLLASKKPSISFTLINLSGKNDKFRNTASTTYYYILKGSGNFVINGKKRAVRKGNLVCVPKNSTYQDAGNLQMLAVAVPKLDAKKIRMVK